MSSCCFFSQSETKSKPIVPGSREFSRARHKMGFLVSTPHSIMIYLLCYWELLRDKYNCNGFLQDSWKRLDFLEAKLRHIFYIFTPESSRVKRRANAGWFCAVRSETTPAIFEYIVFRLLFQFLFIFQSAIKSKGYRSLEEGEKVQFKTVSSDKGTIAAFVTSPDGGNVGCMSRKCRAKKGARKYTSLCYNCNENGHRMKKCPYARRVERTCHKCGSRSHLVRTCPRLMELFGELRTNPRRESNDIFDKREFLRDDSIKQSEDHS